MITLPAAIQAVIDNDPVLTCTLIVLEGPVVHRWCDWTQDVTWNGNVYTHSTPFERAHIVSNGAGASAGSITFDEEDQQLQATDLFEGMKDRRVRIYEAYIDPNNRGVAVGAIELPGGVTQGITFDEASASTGLLNFGQNLFNSSEGPGNSYELECSNEYGDARCKHTGNPCDYTATSCQARNNMTNFRGCRWAETEAKSVQFGPGVSIKLGERNYQ